MSLLPTRREARPARAWSPLAELDDMQRRLDRVVDQLVAGPLAGDGIPWAPLADLEETDDAWIVEVDVPGTKRSDISVELVDDELVIRGEVKERERVGILRRRTRRAGEFDYRVRLPGDVDEDAIDARLADGVLTVRVPKGSRARARRIEVKG
jgi:HSP20 family protein